MNSLLKADLERQQLVEVRALHKNLKTETRTRTLQFKRSQRIGASSVLTPEQELDRVKEVCVQRISASCVLTPEQELERVKEVCVAG